MDIRNFLCASILNVVTFFLSINKCIYIYKLAFVETLSKDETSESLDPKEGTDLKQTGVSNRKFREFICGEEALRISPAEPYCVCRPIRRGHLNISHHYPMQQVHVTSKPKHIFAL
jgi:hypothetical protein